MNFSFYVIRNAFLLLSAICWLCVSSLNSVAQAAWTGEIASDIWQLPATAHSTRWLVIHHREAAKVNGVYHVEVLERAVGAPAWQTKHLAQHMAISVAALRASVLKPLKRGAVYPETFDFAYANWKTQQVQGKAVVCESNVFTCLK